MFYCRVEDSAIIGCINNFRCYLKCKVQWIAVHAPGVNEMLTEILQDLEILADLLQTEIYFKEDRVEWINWFNSTLIKLPPLASRVLSNCNKSDDQWKLQLVSSARLIVPWHISLTLNSPYHQQPPGQPYYNFTRRRISTFYILHCSVSSSV